MADIFEQLRKVQDDMIKTLETAFSSEFKKPLSDISQNAKFVTVNIKLPGINKKDIVLDINKNRIDVKAEIKKKKVKRGKKSRSVEKIYKGFHRRISLPANLNIDKADATFKKNNLTVKIPKLKVKKVKIR